MNSDVLDMPFVPEVLTQAFARLREFAYVPPRLVEVFSGAWRRRLIGQIAQIVVTVSCSPIIASLLPTCLLFTSHCLRHLTLPGQRCS